MKDQTSLRSSSKSKSKLKSKKNQKNHIKSIMNQMNWSSQDIIRLIFIGFSGIIFTYQILSLYYQYIQYQIKIDRTISTTATINTPHITFCFKLTSVLNTTLIFNYDPEILRKVDEVRQFNSDFRNASYSKIIHDHGQVDKLLYGRLSTKQLISSVVPISSLVDFCALRVVSNSSMVECPPSSWIKHLYSKSLCITQHFSRKFKQSETIFDGFQGLALAFFRFNLTLFPLIDQISVAVHSSPGIPWFGGNKFVYLKVRPGCVQEHDLMFGETVINFLPKPYLDDCRPIKVEKCYNKCLIKQFVKKVKAYPREYDVLVFDDNERLIDNYGEEFDYYNLSQRLYEQCQLICGQNPCVEKHYGLKVLKPTKTSTHPGVISTVTFYPSKKVKLYERKPAISFANFISSIGGLIGIWFGLSVNSLVDCILDQINLRLNRLVKIEAKQSTTSKATINKSKGKIFTPVEPKTVNYVPKTHYLTRVNAM